MLRAMDSAVAGLRAHQNKLDVIGHNIANVNTYGFKSQNYTFQEAMYQTSSSSTGGTDEAGGTNAAQYGYGSLMGSISTDMTASTPTYLGGFNASIDGEGFFVTMATKDKTLAADDLKGQEVDFTRVGMFSIDSNGYMVDSSGNFVYGFQAVLTADGAMTDPITYGTDLVALRAPSCSGDATNGYKYSFTGDDALLSNISINDLGEVTATVQMSGETISFGKVAIATFQNPEGLTKVGGIYYNATETDNTGECIASKPGGTTAGLKTGYVEASNVDLAKEFSDMITTQRGFQANSRIITVSDQILEELVNMKR